MTRPASVNGCHNRPPFKPVVELRDYDGRVVSSFPFRMREDCAYTHTALGQSDQRCAGCCWRENREQAPTTSRGAK